VGAGNRDLIEDFLDDFDTIDLSGIDARAGGLRPHGRSGGRRAGPSAPPASPLSAGGAAGYPRLGGGHHRGGLNLPILTRAWLCRRWLIANTLW
jgi:hypothetical protein